MNTNDNNFQNGNTPIVNGWEQNTVPQQNPNQSFYVAQNSEQMNMQMGQAQPMMNQQYMPNNGMMNPQMQNNMMNNQYVPNNGVMNPQMQMNMQMGQPQPMMNQQYMPNNGMMDMQMSPLQEMMAPEPQPMPATPETPVNPTQMPIPGNASPINPTLLSGTSPTNLNNIVQEQMGTMKKPTEQSPINPSLLNSNSPTNLNPQMPSPETFTPEMDGLVAPGPESIAPQEVVMPTMNVNDVTVVSTKKAKKGSGVGIIVIVIILVLVVLNFDKVEWFYDNYVKESVLLFKKDDADSNNLAGDYVLVNDATSSIKTSGIRFSDFSNKEDRKVTFMYTGDEKIDNTSSLGIYVELFDANKDIIYKEQFLPSDGIKKNTSKKYEIELDKDIHEKVRYAVVRKYTSEDFTKMSAVSCSLIQDNGSYKVVFTNKYSFVNNELKTYSVTEELIAGEETGDTISYRMQMENKKNSLSELNPTLTGNVLSYNVDASKTYNSYTLVELYGTTPTMVKYREEAKKWKCE